MRKPLLIGLAIAGLLLPAGLSALALEGPPGGPPKLDPRMPDLFLAAGRDDSAAIKKIVGAGLNADVRNLLGLTPLMWAAVCDKRNAAEALLAAGAKVDAPSPFGSALTMAASEGHERLALTLLDRGAAPEAKRLDNIQPLMLAALYGRVDLMRRLLERGAKVDAKNSDGATALSHAARGGSAEAAALLLERGAAVDAADSRAWTPLAYAAANGHAAVTKALLAKGAKVDARESGGRTPLLLAASYGADVATARFLLEGGADRTATDKRGRTASALAVVRGQSDMAHLLSAGKSEVPGPEPRTIREAAAAGYKLLETSQAMFIKKLGCASCHHQGFALMATALAKERGFAVDAKLAQAQLERSHEAFDGFGEFYKSAVARPELDKQLPFSEIQESNPGDGSLLLGLSAMKAPPTSTLAASTTLLARRQEADGRWTYLLERVPLQSSEFTMTAQAIAALKAYPSKETPAQTKTRIAKAKQWLMTTPVKTSEDRAFRLLGLKWAGATAAELRQSAEAIRADQRSDGGWAQLDRLKSDAYATGEAVYALNVAAGVPVSDPALQKGIAYLRRTQDDDGSWFVNKRAAPVNFYTDVDFPHGESQYASFAATCWATMALMRTLPPVAAGKPSASAR